MELKTGGFVSRSRRNTVRRYNHEEKKEVAEGEAPTSRLFLLLLH